jgi:hypothetical protein
MDDVQLLFFEKISLLDVPKYATCHNKKNVEMNISDHNTFTIK